mgnify:CR=1 FL=1
MKLYYLKKNIVFEALYNNWYAWSYLISPATGAMYLKNSHLKIMESFINNPMVHAAALKNPSMLGGPFIDLPVTSVDEIKNLQEETKSSSEHLCEFADAIRELNTLLMNEADGMSIEELYPRVPDVLKGYIELVYDVNNYPSFRFIEGLLYESEFFNKDAQSVFMYEAKQDLRTFALSTPRVDFSYGLHLKVPYSDDKIKFLTSLQKEAKSLEEIQQTLGLNDTNEILPLLTTKYKEDNPGRNYEGDGVRIRYYGHACVLVETSEVSILVDPLLSYENDSEIERFTYSDLPDKIDYLLITHNHQDHILFEHLIRLRDRVKRVIVPRNGNGNLEDPSLRLLFENLGFEDVTEVDELAKIMIPNGEIIGLPFFGEHADLKIRTKMAHLVRVKEKSILLAADSSNVELELYKRLSKTIGDIDIIFLGMESEGAPLSWLYGPIMTQPLERKKDQSRRLNGSDYEAGLGLIKQFNPKSVFVYAMGMEPWAKYILALEYSESSKQLVDSNRLIQSCKDAGINAERMYLKKEIHL